MSKTASRTRAEDGRIYEIVVTGLNGLGKFCASRNASGADPDTLLDEAGRAWRATDAELVGPDGARGRRLPGSVAYWFAWQAFHPDSELYPAPR